jgi:hypothetical protein
VGPCVKAAASAVVGAAEASIAEGLATDGQDAASEQIPAEGADSFVLGVKDTCGGVEGDHAARS